MRSIFLLCILFVKQDPASSISENVKTRIIAAYTDQASHMKFEYDLYGNRDLSKNFYKLVPEMRAHMPNEKFSIEIQKESITLSFDGTQKYIVGPYIEYTVYSNSDEPPLTFYMIIKWPRENLDAEFSLLRIFKHVDNEGNVVFLTRSALDKIILRETYNDPMKLDGLQKVMKEIAVMNRFKKNECNKAKKATGTYMLTDYNIHSYGVWGIPSNVIVFSDEELYVVAGVLHCEGFGMSFRYILGDADREWILVREGDLKTFLIQGQNLEGIEWFLDDSDENL